MAETTHKNSRTVTVYRTESMLEKVQKDAKDYMGLFNQPIGDYYESGNSAVVATGLEPWEVDILLPSVLMMSNEDREFRPKVKEYYQKISTKVPHRIGVTLEIGLVEDNDKPISKTNLPIKMSDYLRYRHIRKHPWVAPSAAAAKGNMLVKYYIFDKYEQERMFSDVNAEKDKAIRQYLSIGDDPKKVEQMLIMLGVDYRRYEGPNAVPLRKDALRELAETKPTEFNKANENNSFEERYKIRLLLAAGVTQLIGNTLVLVSNPEVILGHSEDEAVVFLKNPANSQTVTLMLRTAQEAMAKGKPNPKGVNLIK